jgi:hypothetical protein
MWTMQPSTEPSVTTTPTSSTPPATTTTTTGPPPVDKLPFDQAAWAGLILLVVLLVTGLILLWTQRLAAKGAQDQNRDRGGSLVRSWIAMSLVIGLLEFCLLTFVVADDALRTTLLGGLLASVGGAIAFYFSARSGEQARKDLMQIHEASALRIDTVPDLKGLTENEAKDVMSRRSLTLEIDPKNRPSPGLKVDGQQPPKDSVLAAGSTVTVSFGP